MVKQRKATDFQHRGDTDNSIEAAGENQSSDYSQLERAKGLSSTSIASSCPDPESEFAEDELLCNRRPDMTVNQY